MRLWIRIDCDRPIGTLLSGHHSDVTQDFEASLIVRGYPTLFALASYSQPIGIASTYDAIITRHLLTLAAGRETTPRSSETKDDHRWMLCKRSRTTSEQLLLAALTKIRSSKDHVTSSDVAYLLQEQSGDV